MFGQANRTEYDLNFDVLGIPVRIHPIFWLSSAMLVWDPDQPARILIGVLCVLFSVLVHELGHAWVARRYGYPSEIVLFFLGGYATGTRFSTWKNVKVYLAGPAAGFVLFGLTYGAFRVLRVQAPELLVFDHPVGYSIRQLLFMNLMWNVINLVPCLPLDGGQTMRDLIQRYAPQNAVERVFQVSILASGAVALWAVYCFQNDADFIPIPNDLLPHLQISAIQPAPRFLIFMFGILCALSVKEYNDFKSRY